MAILFGRNQLPVVVSFIVCGIISGVFYDLLRIKRRIFSTNAVFLFFDDLLFCAFCTLLIIFNAYCFNDGNMKWYEVPVMIFGFWLYRKTLSVLFIGFTFAFIDLLKKLLHYAMLPFWRFYLILKVLLHKNIERLLLELFFVKKKKVFSEWRIN